MISKWFFLYGGMAGALAGMAVFFTVLYVETPQLTEKAPYLGLLAFIAMAIPWMAVGLVLYIVRDRRMKT